MHILRAIDKTRGEADRRSHVLSVALIVEAFSLPFTAKPIPHAGFMPTAIKKVIANAPALHLRNSESAIQQPLEVRLQPCPVWRGSARLKPHFRTGSDTSTLAKHG